MMMIIFIIIIIIMLECLIYAQEHNTLHYAATVISNIDVSNNNHN